MKYVKRTRWLPRDLKLDRESPVPVHTQLYTGLRQALQSGNMAPGSLLPSVQWLCDTYAISTTTVSRVLRDLKLEGVITTARGAGCFVKELPPPVTELVVPGEGPMQVTPRSIFHDLVAGLKQGFAEPARHCVLTHYDERLPPDGELAAQMRLRHADSLVVYRPGPGLATALKGVVGNYRVVSLLARPAGVPVDCVLSDPGPPLRKLLRDRLAAGKRDFIFFGRKTLLADPNSPYSRLLAAFGATLCEAGVKPLPPILDEFKPGATSLAIPDADRMLADRAAALPAGTVVVAATPHIAKALHRPDRSLDLIAYTESPFSVAEVGGLMTLLFLGLARVGEAAAELLRQPAQDIPRLVDLAAEVVVAGNPGMGMNRPGGE